MFNGFEKISDGWNNRAQTEPKFSTVGEISGQMMFPEDGDLAALTGIAVDTSVGLGKPHLGWFSQVDTIASLGPSVAEKSKYAKSLSESSMIQQHANEFF